MYESAVSQQEYLYGDPMDNLGRRLLEWLPVSHGLLPFVRASGRVISALWSIYLIFA